MHPSPSMSTHPIIDRLAEISSGELTVSDLVYVLGQDRSTIERYLKRGQIESLQASNHRQGQAKRRYKIASAAVLTFLLRNTGGDKAVLLEAIRLRFPQHHTFCERTALSGPHSPVCGSESPQPANVIPITGTQAKRTRSMPKEHPDQLFLFTA